MEETKQVELKAKKSLTIESEYELELEKIISTIEKEQAKIVCIQFPRGLAAKAIELADFIESNTSTKCLIWIGPTFGACDLPVGLDRTQPKIDLLIHFGHAPWKYKEGSAMSEISVHEV